MFVRPTLSELVAVASADLRARFPGADTGLRRSVLGVLARVIAGAAWGLYGFVDWAYRQLFVDTADAENVRRHAAFWKIDPKPATLAAGDVDFTGTDGSTVPTGSALQRADGAEYLVTADATIAGGVATAPVEAVLPGAGGDASEGVQLVLVSPIAGVASAAAVAAGGLAGGADAESTEALRDRVLQRMGSVPAAGSADDYLRWSLAVPGVTAAWVKPLWAGLGTVGVTFICGAREDIVPLAGDLAAVDAYIAVRKPVTAALIVFAPVAALLDLEIAISPDTPETRAAIAAELGDFLLRTVEPGATTSLNALRNALYAISPASVLVTPSADVAHAPAEIAVLGSITWS